MNRAAALRILDANFNRSREGLRVCEEVVRFALDDRVLTARLKKARHALTAVLNSFAAPISELVARRDSAGDVGKDPSPLERKRGGETDLFLANLERAKEAVRVLEEVSKLVDGRAPSKFKRIRFELYDIEKRTLPKLEALRDHRPVGRTRRGALESGRRRDPRRGGRHSTAGQGRKR